MAFSGSPLRGRPLYNLGARWPFCLSLKAYVFTCAQVLNSETEQSLLLWPYAQKSLSFGLWTAKSCCVCTDKPNRMASWFSCGYWVCGCADQSEFGRRHRASEVSHAYQSCSLIYVFHCPLAWVRALARQERQTLLHRGSLLWGCMQFHQTGPSFRQCPIPPVLAALN